MEKQENKHWWLVVISLSLCIYHLSNCEAFAQTRKVSGTYIYYSEPSQSYIEAKAAAILNAKMQVLAKEFGTLLVQSTLQHTQQKNGQENEYFTQLSEAEVKGEWIEDIKEPVVVRKDITDDGIITFEVTVEGKAKPINNEAVEFEALVLRNGTDKHFAATEFIEHDDIYLYFRSPVDGYVAVYLADDSGNVNCLLPYKGDNDGQHPVKHGKEYVFFSRDKTDDIPKSLVDVLYMTCDDPLVELNTMYVLFSPNSFTKAIDEERQASNRVLPRQLSNKDFLRWMGKLCARDKKLGRKIIRISVKKQ
jgi:hypothetical protein